MKRMKFIRGLSWVLTVALISVMFKPMASLAARPDSVKDTLSDSRASQSGVIHDFFIDQASGTTLASGETVTLTFNASFNISSIAFGDIVLFKDGALTKTIQSGACGSTDTVQYTLSSQTMTFTACNSYSSGASGGIIEIKIGGTNKISNPAAGTYNITAFGTYGDSTQDTSVVTLPGIAVSATINQTLTFSIGTIAAGSCSTTGGTTISSTANAMPFATVTANTLYDICESLTVATNAASGYSTTVQTAGAFTNGTQNIAKGTCDGACSDTTAAVFNTATSNGYAYCMKDTTGTAANTADGTAWTAANQCGGGTQKFKTVPNAGASETAQAVMSKASGTGGDVSTVGWRLDVGASQAPGSYTTTAVYIATAAF